MRPRYSSKQSPMCSIRQLATYRLVKARGKVPDLSQLQVVFSSMERATVSAVSHLSSHENSLWYCMGTYVQPERFGILTVRVFRWSGRSGAIVYPADPGKRLDDHCSYGMTGENLGRTTIVSRRAKWPSWKGMSALFSDNASEAPRTTEKNHRNKQY